MSSDGAKFTLSLHDDPYDGVLQARSVLAHRIECIKKLKKVGPSSTLSEINKDHNLFIMESFKPCVAAGFNYIKVTPHGSLQRLTSSAQTLTFKMNTANVQFINDMVLHIKLSAIGSDPRTIASMRYRYCAYPGIRIIKEARLVSKEIVIDKYTRDDVLLYEKHMVDPQRISARKRLYGQQEIKKATYYSDQNYSGIMNYADGLQTLKYYHEDAHLWIPLHFNICRDANNSLIRDHIPQDTLQIEIDLDILTNIVKVVDEDQVDVTLPFNNLTMENELYVRTIAVNTDVYTLLRDKINYTLIRIHKQQVITLTESSGFVQLSQMRYPIEYLILGVRDTDNVNNFDYWNLFGRARARTNLTNLLVPTIIYNNTKSLHQLVYRIATELTTLDNIVDYMNISAFGNIDLSPYVNPTFYNSYIPERFSGAHGKTFVSGDDATMMVAFDHYPGNNEISGYYSAHVGRELQLNYAGSSIVSSNPAELIISTSVINMLVRKHNSVSLVFSL